MIKKNDIFTLKIESVSNEGFGVARTDDGFVIFVPFCIGGEVCKVRVVKVLRTYAFGKIEEIIESSSDRINPNCKVFGKCGGCSLCHMNYKKELEYKASWVKENMEKIGGLYNLPFEDIIPSPNVERYRNKAELPATTIEGKVRFGFFSRHSHRVIEIDDCLLTPNFFVEIVKATEDYVNSNNLTAYNEETLKGTIRHLYIRYGQVTGQVMVCLVINANTLPNLNEWVEKLKKLDINLTSVVLNINKNKTNEILGNKCETIYGSEQIVDYLGEFAFNISPLSFYQVNHDSTINLYNTVKEFADLGGYETVLDLYCGAGTIGIYLSKNIKELYGVEVVPEAIENAKQNAKSNNIKNAKFFCGDAGKAAKEFAEKGIDFDVVIIDPPRKGINDDVIGAIDKFCPKKLIMVSCNSSTAARDLAKLDEIGYKIQRIKTVDMFCRTSHVETVVLLSKVNTPKA